MYIKNPVNHEESEQNFVDNVLIESTDKITAYILYNSRNFQTDLV